MTYASLVVEGAVDEGGPQREFLTLCMASNRTRCLLHWLWRVLWIKVDHKESFSPCACKQLNKMSASWAVDEGGPQREFLTLCMQAIEQDVCFTGCEGCCG